MNETIEQPVTAPEPVQGVEPAPEPPISIAEHAAKYGPHAEPAEDAAEPAADHHSAQQRRDKPTGQFDRGKVRHRAKSQQASPEDVPRIRELSTRNKALEDEVARLKGAGPANAPPEPRVSQPPAAVPATVPAGSNGHRAPVRAPERGDDPEPNEDDPKYEGNWPLFHVEHTRWTVRDETHKAQTKAFDANEKRRQDTEQEQAIEAFAVRVMAAEQKYTDFRSVAFGKTTIPGGSAIDAFIMEDDAGPDVLYYLQQHPQERDSLLQMTPLQQLKSLSLLSQRLSPPSEQAGTTGAAAGRASYIPPPRPPTPVRTEAQRIASSPPTDGSLSIAEHHRAFGPKSR